jgi:5'(3')-deoxyribonucleotidase
MSSDRVALIDLDGTTADYDLALKTQLNLLRSPSEEKLEYVPYGEMPTWLENRIDLIKRQPGFWSGLQPIPIGLHICELLQDTHNLRLMVLSKGPRRTTSAWSEKVEWVTQHLPKADITITHDKGLTYGKVLFDDYPPYILRWLEHRPRGKVLMLETPYNRTFQHPNVLKITRSEVLQPHQEIEISRFVVEPLEGHRGT